MTFARIKSGNRGEELAVSYLRREGYKIIERNYRTKLGEIDIIADYKNCICFYGHGIGSQITVFISDIIKWNERSVKMIKRIKLGRM